MLTKSTEVLAKDLGLKNIASSGTKDERAYGIYKNYLLAISERDGKKTAFFGCPFNTDEDSVFAFEFSQALNETVNEIAKCVVTVDNDGVAVTSACDLAAFREVINATVELLSANEIPTADKCVKCGSKLKDNIMVLNNGGYLSLICESCALKASLENNRKKASAKADGQQRIKGILGALLGAVVGFLLIIGISYLVDLIISADVSLSYGVSALCFGTATLTYFVSKLFCKTRDIPVTISVCVFSVLLNAAARIIVSAYQVLTAYGYSLSTAMNSLGTFLRLPFTTPADGVNLYQSLIIDLLFALVALAIFAFGLFSSAKKSNVTIERFLK